MSAAKNEKDPGEPAIKQINSLAHDLWVEIITIMVVAGADNQQAASDSATQSSQIDGTGKYLRKRARRFKAYLTGK